MDDLAGDGDHHLIIRDQERSGNTEKAVLPLQTCELLLAALMQPRRSAQLAVLAAPPIYARVDDRLVAFALTGDAGPHARQCFPSALWDAFAAILAVFQPVSARKPCTCAPDGIGDRVVDLILYCPIARPSAGHGSLLTILPLSSPATHRIVRWFNTASSVFAASFAPPAGNCDQSTIENPLRRRLLAIGPVGRTRDPLGALGCE
ncbi:hypothetical protein NOVOSPHI9U_60137 [Novosphingobium sp. 9U]|nr:hypothetical protein NOVOSPHI9U_60137 [Novosphingobium sp. 9U]